ncbi:helix-turn-helix domain-containing protein [Sinomicrobium sp. M5D2P9]
MKKTIKEHRLSRHLTQQELAVRSGVSIRTIQRLENNDTNGSPFVLKSLCKALKIPEDAFTNNNENFNSRNTQIDDNSLTSIKQLKYINLSSLVALIIPFSNLIVPAILYFVFRKYLSHKNDKKAALKIISFQIMWSALTLVLMVFISLFVQLVFGTSEIMEVPIFIWIYLVFISLLLVITFSIAARLNQSKDILSFSPNLL